MESINGDGQIHAVLHCDTSNGGDCNEPHGLRGNARVDGGFHTCTFASFPNHYAAPPNQQKKKKDRFTLDRTVSPNTMTWAVDGTTFFSLNQTQFSPATWTTLMGHGYIIILNVAVGGQWAGPPTQQTTSGGVMSVDYVAVYRVGEEEKSTGWYITFSRYWIHELMVQSQEQDQLQNLNLPQLQQLIPVR